MRFEIFFLVLGGRGPGSCRNASTVFFRCWSREVRIEQIMGGISSLILAQLLFPYPMDFQNSLFQLNSILTLREEHSPGSRRSLLALMIDLRYGVCSDPRDKLFAFLGVTTDELAVLNPPDYLVDTVQVYTRFTRTWINKNRSLDILGCCRPLYRFSGLPSWVPDWSDGEDRTLTAVGFDPEAKHPLYGAGLGSAPLSVHLLGNASSADPNCLILGGAQVDSVFEVGSTTRREHGGGPPPDDLMLELRSIAQRLSTDRAHFWRTLTMDLGWTGGRMDTPQKQAFERTLDKWLRSDCKKWPNRGFSLLFPRVTGMTFFTTVRGNMGLTENDT
jgi:hypothetical protein